MACSITTQVWFHLNAEIEPAAPRPGEILPIRPASTPTRSDRSLQRAGWLEVGVARSETKRPWMAPGHVQIQTLTNINPGDVSVIAQKATGFQAVWFPPDLGSRRPIPHTDLTQVAAWAARTIGWAMVGRALLDRYYTIVDAAVYESFQGSIASDGVQGNR
jgi:hypothetical protein